MNIILNTISVVATYIVAMSILYFVFFNVLKLILKPKIVHSITFNFTLFLLLNVVLLTNVEFHRPW